MPTSVDVINEASPADVRTGFLVVTTEKQRIAPEMVHPLPASKGVLLYCDRRNSPDVVITIGPELGVTFPIFPGTFITIPTERFDKLWALADSVAEGQLIHWLVV